MSNSNNLTHQQMQILAQQVEAAKTDSNVTRVAAILRSAPLESDEFQQALRSAEGYGPGPEICAIWMLASSAVRNPDIDIVEKIMEDTYYERMAYIHASKMTAAILAYYNTPPK